jgi:hypothetical protein
VVDGDDGPLAITHEQEKQLADLRTARILIGKSVDPVLFVSPSCASANHVKRRVDLISDIVSSPCLFFRRFLALHDPTNCKVLQCQDGKTRHSRLQTADVFRAAICHSQAPIFKTREYSALQPSGVLNYETDRGIHRRTEEGERM